MTNDYTCELCDETYTSYRAMMTCEEACIEENRNRKPNPKVTIPRVRWDAE